MKIARMAIAAASLALVAACSNTQFTGNSNRTANTTPTTANATPAPGSTTPGSTGPANGTPGVASPTPGIAGTTPSSATPGVAGTTPSSATPGIAGTTPANPTSTATSTGIGSGGSPACNLSGDFVQLQFPPAIQNCINQGLIYDFNSGSCFSNVTQASTYACSFAGVQQALESIGMSSTQLLASQQPGAKLVGCGERRNGQTIVLQWWVPPPNSTSCSYSANTVIGTECYGSFPSGTAPSQPGNTPAGVEACVNAD